MEFNERLKQIRNEKKMTQREMAEGAGVTLRTYQLYEQGKNFPSKNVLLNICTILGVTADELLSPKDACLLTVDEKQGTARDRARIKRLTNDVSALFAGGTLSEADKDAAMRALTEAYWKARELNRETYTPRKYRKGGKPHNVE